MTAQPDDMPGDPRLGQLIREQIRRRRLTHDEVAEAVGVHRSTLSRWISGDADPSPHHLAALERALGVRFVNDGAGRYAALDAVPDAPPDTPPTVVNIIVVTSPDEAVEVVRRIQAGLDPQ